MQEQYLNLMCQSELSSTSRNLARIPARYRLTPKTLKPSMALFSETTASITVWQYIYINLPLIFERSMVDFKGPFRIPYTTSKFTLWGWHSIASAEKGAKSWPGWSQGDNSVTGAHFLHYSSLPFVKKRPHEPGLYLHLNPHPYPHPLRLPLASIDQVWVSKENNANPL